MRRRPVRLVLLLALTLQLGWTDQVTLKNGDRITGVAVKKEDKNLTFKSEFLGTVTIPWIQVESLRTDFPVNVVLKNGKTELTTLQPSEGRIELKEAHETVSPADIEAIRNTEEQKAYERMLHPGWGQVWTGTASIGFAGTKGNAETQTFTTALNASRITHTDKTSLYFSAIKASALVSGVNAETARAVRGGWAYDHNLFSSRLFVNTFNDWEYDRFQNLDLRFVIGGGLGYSVWKGERGALGVIGGADYNRSKFSPPDLTRESAEVFWGNDFAYKLTGATALVQSFRMFDNVSNTGQYRINFDMSANTTLKKWLTWTLGLSDRNLSDPVPGRKKNDFLYTTGIGITFAR